MVSDFGKSLPAPDATKPALWRGTGSEAVFTGSKSARPGRGLGRGFVTGMGDVGKGRAWGHFSASPRFQRHDLHRDPKAGLPQKNNRNG